MQGSQPFRRTHTVFRVNDEKIDRAAIVRAGQSGLSRIRSLQDNKTFGAQDLAEDCTNRMFVFDKQNRFHQMFRIGRARDIPGRRGSRRRRRWAWPISC